MSHPRWELAISGAVPAIVAMWLVDRLDRKRPEPLRLRRLSAAFGMVTVLPAVVLETATVGAFGDSFGARLTYQGASFHAFFVAAAIEEACKISVLYWLVWWQPEFDERMDGIVYASRAGLGFALVENVMYLFGEHTLGGQIETWIMRAVLAVPGHAMWTGMAGAMAARRRFDGKGLGLIGGYLLAVSFHGTYDLTAFLQVPLHLEGYGYLAKLAIPALALLTVCGFFVLRGMAKSALRLDDIDAARRGGPPLISARPPVPAG
jgi:RsiW-degrading membrane proteinase PrsW (M82 family)